MAVKHDAGDSGWLEAELINEHVKTIRILFLSMKGLGVLILTWTTVVLLGGFVSVLEMKDFWSLTVITVIQLPGAFDFQLTEQMRQFRQELLKPKPHDRKHDGLTEFKKLKTELRKFFSSIDSLGCKIIVSAVLGVVFVFMLLVASVIVLPVLLVASVIVLPVLALVWFGLYTSTGISLWRLVEHSHRNTDDGGANLEPSLYILYSLAVAQGVLSIFRSLFSSTRTKAVKQVKEYYHLNDIDLVLDYVKETNVRFKKDISSSRDGRWNLVTYGMELLRKSDRPEIHISAVRAVFSASSVKRQRPLKQLLIGNESFNLMISKLLQMMHPRSLYSRETRENAAGIVALLADQIHLEQFPGGLQFISSLLDTSEEYPWLPEKCQRDYALGLAEESDKRDWLLGIKKTYKIHKMYELSKQEEPEDSSLEIGGIITEYRYLFLQCLYIFGKLSNDHDNCRIIGNAEGLMSRITAPLFSILLHHGYHKEWTIISEESLILMCRLMTIPGDTGRKLRHQISSNDKAIRRMLHFILGCDECYKELLSVIAVEIMLDLSVDTSSIVASRRCSRRLITVLLQIFLNRYCLDDELPFQKLYYCIHWMKKCSYIRSLAGQKLAWISLQSQSNAKDILHVISESTTALEDITNILVADTNNTYRIRAAELLEHLCSNCTNDDKCLKSLNKAVLDVMPEVLAEILGWESTGGCTQAGNESNQQSIFFGNLNTPSEEGPALPDNGQRNIYFSHQQNGDVMPKMLNETLGWRTTGACTQAENESNQPRYSAADADLEEGPALPDNGQRNIYFSHQQNSDEQEEPWDNKLHEALLSLCVTVYQKLTSTDPDMDCRFNEIAFGICSEQRKPPKTFTLLVEEAREILKMKNPLCLDLDIFVD